ncbi:MAG: O-methyltransferase [Clostridia bacterium]|jgi:caffeoyl-CoA O-methyltransferase|nr:O-methyltransferase [Clostridia bacterium]
MSLSDSEFFTGLIRERKGIEGKIRSSASDGRRIPIIRDDTATLLEILVSQKKPEKILEFGTAIGYSAIIMAKASDCVKSIDTVEIDTDMVIEARKNIENASLSNIIHVIAGDAAEVASCLSGSYDMIFLDSAKSQYVRMYEDLKRLLPKGGLLVCDNVIYYGKVYDEPENSPHKQRTIVANMRDFLKQMFEDEEMRSVIADVGDGLAISEKL